MEQSLDYLWVNCWQTFFWYCWKKLWYIPSKRFYSTGDMTNLYPFVQGWLQWPFNDFFFSDVSFWNEYKYIDFNISSWRTLIISYKILIITGISNKKQAVLRRNVAIFCREKLASLFQVQGKLKACWNSK